MPNPLPLDDFFVVDLTAHRAGPTAVRQLADWGADVIKVEAPGEAIDATGSRRDGSDFQNLHRNKRSMTLNLKSKEGLEIFFKLARRADVIVENYKSDVKHRLGVDYESVKKVNPRIVYGSISGFGQDGPYAGRPGVDQIAQGMGGLMSVTGHPGQGPVRVGIAINDTSAGLLLSYAIVLALLDRERTGEGQWVHTSLLEAQIFMLDFQAARYLMKGEVAGQAGNFHPDLARHRHVRDRRRLHQHRRLGRQSVAALLRGGRRRDLLDNPDFATVVSRAKNRDALIAHLNEIMRRHPNAYWVELMNKAGVPCGPINTIDQTFADPQVRHLGIAKPIDHPTLGAQKVVGQPIHLSRYPQPERAARPTADQGEHTVRCSRTRLRRRRHRRPASARGRVEESVGRCHSPAAGVPLPASSASSSASRLARARSTMRQEMIDTSNSTISGIARLVWLIDVGRGQHRGDDEHDDDRVAPLGGEPGGGDEPDPRHQGQQHRQLKRDPEGEQQGHHERQVLVDLGFEHDRQRAGAARGSRS